VFLGAYETANVDALEMFWKCFGNALEMLWNCSGNALEMLWKCSGNV
jgi:hypothetical protein